MSDTDAGRLAALLPPVLDAVAAAGTAILEVYATAHDVEFKADDSPLTRADRAAHEVLAARLAAITPEVPVLSEEHEAGHARAVRGPWR
jgi:3'(2'), 5'-bisphosphate nucleotidase